MLLKGLQLLNDLQHGMWPEPVLGCVACSLAKSYVQLLDDLQLGMWSEPSLGCVARSLAKPYWTQAVCATHAHEAFRAQVLLRDLQLLNDLQHGMWPEPALGCVARCLAEPDSGASGQEMLPLLQELEKRNSQAIRSKKQKRAGRDADGRSLAGACLEAQASSLVRLV